MTFTKNYLLRDDATHLRIVMAAIKTKITDTFSLTADDGIIYQVHEHTRYIVKKLATGKREELGASYLKTEDGRGVSKLQGNTYAIPSLGIKAVR